MSDPSAAQPDDEQPVTETPAERQATPGEQQPKPEHDLEQDDDLRSGQFGPDGQ